MAQDMLHEPTDCSTTQATIIHISHTTKQLNINCDYIHFASSLTSYFHLIKEYMQNNSVVRAIHSLHLPLNITINIINITDFILL